MDQSKRNALKTIGAIAGASALNALLPAPVEAATPVTDQVNVADYLLPGISVDEAFKRANQSLKKLIDTSTLAQGRYTGRAKLVIPAGSFTLTRTDSFLTEPDARTLGLIIEGQGRGTTEIFFKPNTDTDYLITNNDKWLHVTIRDISFRFTKGSFLNAKSTGGAQNFLFERVNWENAKYGVHLIGNNNNSECTFLECGIYGKVSTFFWSETSDQFLNYNFFACNFEVSSGDFCRFDKGGNINIWGGSFIHTDTSGGTFFKLLGTQHSAGVMRFLCTGARFEHRKSASKLIQCEWAAGSVQFISCDMSSQMFDYKSSTITAVFSSNNTAMPIIRFEGCLLLGRHEYQYMVASFQYNHLITYSNCEFYSANRPDEFIHIKNKDGNVNEGGIPPIKFANCRGGDRLEMWDSTLHLHTANIGGLQTKVASIKNADGKFPYRKSTSASIKLPFGAVITKAILCIPPKASTSGAKNDYTLKNQAGKTFVSQKVGLLRDGFKTISEDNLLYICDSEAKRTITLSAGSGVDQAVGNGALCIIEYLA